MSPTPPVGPHRAGPTVPVRSAPSPPAAPRLHRLRPAACTTGPLVHRTELPASAWCGLHLDGALVAVWQDVSRPADVPEDPPLRAAAVASFVPARAVVGHATAAWVHAGGPAPDRVDVLVRGRVRRPEPHPRRRVAEADLGDADVVDVGGVAVTTVLRTATDLARWLPGERALPLLRRLEHADLRVDDLRRALDARDGGRHVRRARATVRSLADAARARHATG